MADRIGYPPELFHQSQYHQIVYLQSDLLDDKDKDAVPLKTDLSALPPHQGPSERTPTIDAERYNAYECDLEAQVFSVIRLSESRMTHIREHEAANLVCVEMMEVMEKCDDSVMCGFDTERDGCTFQTSIKIPNAMGRGKHYEKNILFQMKTYKNQGTNILQGGIPTKMRQFFSHPKLVFVGKKIRDDVITAISMLEIDVEAMNKMRYLEMDQLFTFAYNLIKSPMRARGFMEANQNKKDEVDPYYSVMCPAGLKTLSRLARPSTTLEKRSIHRNHRNNFDEHNGPLKFDEKRYAILDAVESREATILICERVIGAKPCRFFRKFRTDRLVDDGIIRILLALEDPKLIDLPDVLERQRKQMEACSRGLEKHFNLVTYTVRRWRKKKEWAKAALKCQRDPRCTYETRECTLPTQDSDDEDDHDLIDTSKIIPLPPLSKCQKFFPPDSDDGWNSEEEHGKNLADEIAEENARRAVYLAKKKAEREEKAAKKRRTTTTTTTTTEPTITVSETTTTTTTTTTKLGTFPYSR